MRALCLLVLVSNAAGQSGADRVERERAANQAAFEKDYLPVAAKLRETDRGKWLVIAQGVVLPRRDGLAPAETLAEADREARKTFSETAHRFVFQIGSEGDSRELVGAAAATELAGEPLLKLLTPCWVHSGGVEVERGGRRIEIGSAQAGRGTFLSPVLRAPLATAEDEPEREGPTPALLVSNVFTAAVSVSAATAKATDLAQWEVPGTATVLPGYDADAEVKPLALARRALVRCVFTGLDEEHTVIALVWPALPPPGAAGRPTPPDRRRGCRPPPTRPHGAARPCRRSRR